MNKYEQLIEYIINDDEAKAKALFHDIVIAKSREIYESLVDEEQDQEEELGGNPVEDLVDEVSADEEGMSEDDEEMDAEVDDAGMSDEEDHHADVGGEEELEDRVMDLETALDELKSEFDALMGDEASDGEGMDSDLDGGDMDMGMGGDDMGMDSDDEEISAGMYEAKKKDMKNKKHMSEAERIREYVEKVSDGHGAEKAGAGEGGEVGKGGSAAVNKQSIVAGKNDMGGTASNLNKGGAEQAPDGTSPKAAVKAKGEFTGQFQNKPGAKANMGKAPAAKTGEEGGVNDKSPLAR
jgi:hypothetical protein